MTCDHDDSIRDPHKQQSEPRRIEDGHNSLHICQLASAGAVTYGQADSPSLTQHAAALRQQPRERPALPPTHTKMTYIDAPSTPGPLRQD